jgi:hypothetical protein
LAAALVGGGFLLRPAVNGHHKQVEGTAVKTLVCCFSLVLCGDLAAAVGTAARQESSAAADLIPRAAGIKKDRPRLLLRPADTPYAVSLKQLRAPANDRAREGGSPVFADTNTGTVPDAQRMIAQLEGLKPPRAAGLAMVYLLTGREEAARRAVEVMQKWQLPQDKKVLSDPFYVYFTLGDMALAYDWLHGYPGFSAEAKAALREKLRPVAESGYRLGNDHVFHNYVWMFNGGAMLWTLATLGDDPAADKIFAGLRDRFNHQLFRAMEYLEGSNGDSAGYWWLYCQESATLVLLATQSAFETDAVGRVRREHGDWLGRQLDYLVLSVLPDMRFVPWGDIVAGANGGVTHEMAAKIDMLTWALRGDCPGGKKGDSPHLPERPEGCFAQMGTVPFLPASSGAFLSRWLAEKRGLERFYGETAIFYFLYTRQLDVKPAPPPLAVLAGGKQGGHALMRSDWTDAATVVGFRATDYFGQHLHLDQGSFVVYRNGLLALDAGRYGRVGGEQMRTDAHNTLLFGGEGQRRLGYQSAATLDAFVARRNKDLETGDIPFYKHAGEWTAVAGQFAQAYSPEVIQSCVRQLLFVRPGTVAIVDQLAAPEGKSLPEVRWLLHVPGKPEVDGATVTASNGKSYLQCRSLVVGADRPQVGTSYRTPAGPNSSGGNPATIDTSRVTFTYDGKPRLVLIHVLDMGDGKPAAAAPDVKIETDTRAIRLRLDGKMYSFSAAPPFGVVQEGP